MFIVLHLIKYDKKLGKNIENVYLLNKEMILLGDFNVDFNCAEYFRKHSFMKTLFDLNMSQFVEDITRPLSNTCLDHIWCSNPERMNDVHVKNSGMSDHLPVVVTRLYKRIKPNGDAHVTMTYRNIKRLNKEEFIASLKSAPWDCAFLFENVDDVLDTWYTIFKNAIDEHLPLQQKRVKRKVQPKWFTRLISQEIKKRDKLLKKARKNNSEADCYVFKHVKNNVNNLIKKTKQDYFKEKVSEHKNNSSKLWNLIKCLSKDGNEKKNGISQIIENDAVITENKTIAEIFNCYFIDQPKKILALFGRY